MTHSSVRPSVLAGFVLAVCASVLILIQPWEATAEAPKKKRFSVECVGSVALLYERGEFLDSAVVGSLGCEMIRAEAAK